METKSILTTQKEVVKDWKSEFQAQACDEGIKYVYKGGMTEQSYCEFLRIDYSTVCLLGEISYSIEYNCTEGNKYILTCETYIDNFMNGKLSFELADDEDYLGFYGETSEGVGKAQWLPDNWKELITDEQKEEIAKEWCNENTEELKGYLSDSDKSDIAYDYMDENPSECASHSFETMGSYEQKDFIKDCIDNL